MLEVIRSRGLPLDRITTTDVWATDTIPAYLPPLAAFRDRMDQWIWDQYRIEVEHLYSRNKDGTKRTYEQMFYHVPVRRSQSGQVERERERVGCSPDPEYRVQGSITGFPPNTRYNWCQKLKIPSRDGDQGMASVKQEAPVVPTSQNTGIYGFQTIWVPWCRGELKMHLRQVPFSSGHPTRCRKRNIVEYLGIAADEPSRQGQLNDRKRAPLVEFGIDEDLCGLYCQYNGILAPTYETSCRDGCWFCHNQGVDQLRLLRRNYPDHWALLMKWDLDSPISFKADGHTVHDFDRRFRMEDERKIPTDRTFRWSMLDKPPKFVAYTGDQLSLSGFRR